MVKKSHVGMQALLLTVASLVLVAQATPDPAFEVASIKPNTSVDGDQLLSVPPGEFTATSVTLGNLIHFAYQIRDFQLSGGLKWFDSDRFDVVAKADGAASPTQIRLMVRALLAERFKLTMRRETQELPIYALVVARTDGKLGSRLRRSGPDCAPLSGMPSPATPRPQAGLPPPADPNGPPRCGAMFGLARIGGRELTMAQLANGLSQRVARIVVDRTRLIGTFDFDVDFTPDQMPPVLAGAPPLPPIDPNGPSIFTALQEQLGLRLESTKGPVDVFVVEHAEQLIPN